MTKVSDHMARAEASMRRTKIASCFAVAGCGLSTAAALFNPASYWGYGWAVVIVLWVTAYFVITATLAANQRLVMVTEMLVKRDFDGMQRFNSVPLSLHTVALLVFDDPYKLYGRRRHH